MGAVPCEFAPPRPDMTPRMAPSTDGLEISGTRWSGGTGVNGFTSSKGDGGFGWATCGCTGRVSFGGSAASICSLGGSGRGVWGAARGGGGGGSGAALRGAAALGSGDGPEGALMRGVRSVERNSRMVLLGLGAVWVNVSGGRISGVI